MSENIEYITSNKKSILLVYENGIFVKDRSNGDTTSWRCEHHRKFQCKKRVRTTNDEFQSEHGEHSHELDPTRVAAKRTYQTMKEHAVTNLFQPLTSILAQGKPLTKYDLPNRFFSS